MSDVIIFGAGDYARIASVYLEADSEHTVAGFAVDGAFLDRKELLGKPVGAFEDMVETHPPDRVELLVAIGFSGMNQRRREVYERCKKLGYRFVTYVNSRAYRWGNIEVGENTFIFEANVLQPFVRIGNNCVLWSGNHIGHDSRIGDHCFIASHVVISGNCVIGDSCFIGVNATFRDGVKVAPRCLIGAGAAILKDTEEGDVYSVKRTEAREMKSWDVKF
ncbi:MAG TPA: acetyltransferase [Candidatus Dormibacteraeota bacterium]|nr:acetyltransferase [Candidatus Dormibacteraeota bacterium]